MTSKSASLSLGLIIISSAPVIVNISFFSFSEITADIRIIGIVLNCTLDFYIWHNLAPLTLLVLKSISNKMARGVETFKISSPSSEVSIVLICMPFVLK